MNQPSPPEFSGPGARLQYRLLMAGFRFAVTRGFYGRLARGLGRVFAPDNAALVDIGGAAPFRVRLNDGYWTRFALRRTPYEPEIGRVLTAAGGYTDTFLDLGANTGFWTLRAARLFENVTAVETAAETFRWLEKNAGGLDTVTLRHAAVYSQGDTELRIVVPPLSHASARISRAGEPVTGEQVETIRTVSIDGLLSEGTAALIKLDVEGAEVAAFEGATRAFADGSVAIYEDHGNDPACTPTDWLLGRGGFSLWSLEDRPRRIDSLVQARALKTDRFKGYNFLAAQDGAPLLSSILRELQTHPSDAGNGDPVG